MNFVGIVTVIVFVMIFLTIIIFILAIAGKDIWLAIERWINKKGCSVFIMNPNRNISEYYMTPKDGLFKINKLPYLTNPDKVLNLDEPTKLKIVDSKLKHTKKLTDRIQKLVKDKERYEGMLDTCKDYEENMIKQHISKLENMIVELTGKLKNKTQNYFKDKRPAFFYIEGDPLPKDMHEFMSTMDNTVMDNMMARKISDPKNQAQDKQFNNIRLLVLGAAIAAGIACLLAFRNNTALMMLCKEAGLACSSI